MVLSKPHVVTAPPLSDLHQMLAKIGRERHAARINKVVNDPSVFDWVRGNHKGPLDLTPVVANPSNILLMGQHGGILFVQLQHGLYEAHTQVLPEGRGKWAFEMVQAAIHWMFTRSDAFEIMTRCPRGNLGARALAKAIGGKFEFTNPRGWVKDGETISADIFSINIQEWMRRAPGLEERGEWFHHLLEDQYRRLGYKEPLHPEDRIHDRYVGAACEMILNKQASKAAILYNRWAKMADYATIEIMCVENPTAVNIRDAILMVREDGTFYVASITASNFIPIQSTKA